VYENALLGIIGALGGTFLGWYLHRWTQRDLLKLSAIKDELTNALGPLYGIVHQRAISVTQGINITRKEKEELDRIIATYPHLLPSKIALQWRLWVKDLEPSSRNGRTYEPIEYAIPVDFRKIIVEEFCKKLTEYFEATGQSERLEEIDEYRKPWE